MLDSNCPFLQLLFPQLITVMILLTVNVFSKKYSTIYLLSSDCPPTNTEMSLESVEDPAIWRVLNDFPRKGRDFISSTVSSISYL